MNKNDFYKELMQSYTFNEEEIKKNAMKQKFARNRLNSIKLASLVGSVAVCTVLVGTLLVTQLGKNGNGVVIQPSALADMSTEDRIRLALENADKYGDSDISENLMVTFTRSYGATEVNDIFAQYSTDEHPIQIKKLYFEDDTKAVGDAVIDVFKNGDSRLVKGAAINCSLILFKELNTDSAICLIELMTEDDEQAAPIDVDTIKSETLDEEFDITDAPAITDAPVNTQTPDTTVGSDVSEIAPEDEDDVDLNDPNLPPAPDTEDAVTAENPVVTLPPVTEAPIVTDPSTGEEITTEVTDVPSTEPEIPVISLPTEVPKTSVTVSAAGATNAYFVGENTFLMTTSSTFELYTLKNGTFTNALTVYGDAPKIHWLSTDGKYAIISVCDSYGTRTAVYFIDTVSFISTQIDLTDVLMGSSSIKNVAYNADSETLVFVFNEDEKNYIGVVGVRSDGVKNYSVQAYDSKNSIYLLAMNGSSLYFAESKDSKSSAVHKLDIQSLEDTVIKTYGISPKFSKNTAFNCGIIIPNENDVIGFTEIFDAKTEKFIQTDYFIATVSFSLDGRYFAAGDSSYVIETGGISQVKSTTEILKAIDYKNSLSKTYSVSSVADGVITIKASSYSDSNLASDMTYTAPTADLNTEIRSAFENAVGVNNLFSEYTTSIGEYHPIDGLSSISSAKALVAEYYSAEITDEILRKCELTASENKLFCKIATGLKPISVSECTLELVSKTENTAVYTLYQKRGSFNGKAGYTTKTVNFVKENGKWKLATSLN